MTMFCVLRMIDKNLEGRIKFSVNFLYQRSQYAKLCMNLNILKILFSFPGPFTHLTTSLTAAVASS